MEQNDLCDQLAKSQKECEELRRKEDYERKKFYVVLGIMAVLIAGYLLWDVGIKMGLAGSNSPTGYAVNQPAKQEPVCKQPYITTCCLDENNNKVCDGQEKMMNSANKA
jgi:hypothetical protein